MKKTGKFLIAVGCSTFFCLSSMSCQTNKEKTVENVTLTVVTDPTISTEVEDVAKFMQETSEIKVDVNVLPSDQSERDTKIQKLRTQIMSGKGADVYLMDTNLDTAKITTALFKNPYKSMQSGVFAPLDQYMKKDSYWKDNTYNTSILKAGKYEKKQYILPLSCSYYVFCGNSVSGKIQGNNLEEWLEYVKQSSDMNLKSVIGTRLDFAIARWFQPAVDYENQEILFDKEKWQSFTSSYLQFRHELMGENAETQDDSYEFSPINAFEKQDIEFAQVMPDLKGRKMASVKAYGAVGMSSEHKEEAYRFLMLFLNDKTQKSGNELMKFVDKTAVPVQQDEIKNWLFDASEEEISAVEESFKEIDGAYFITNVEKTLIAKMWETVTYGVVPEEGWETFASDLAEEVWNKYEMEVKE